MLDSAGKGVAEQGHLQFLAERRSDWISLTDAGREFHARDAATGNARRHINNNETANIKDEHLKVCNDM